MSTAPSLPLLGTRDLDAPLAWQQGQPVSARQFLADVQAQAARLPEAGPAINVCADRYAFCVGLAAALLRGQPSLLPPDARPDTLARVGAGLPQAYVLGDAPIPGVPLAVQVPARAGQGDAPAAERMTEGATESAVPLVPAECHALSLLTSGSTGTPQPHAKTWRTLTGDVAAAVPRLCALLGRDSLAGLTLVATVPVQHSYGLESTALLAMLGGASFDSGRPFFPADIVRSLESVPRPRALVTTPFHLKTLLQSGLALPPVELLLSATAPLSPQLAAQAEAATGGMLLEIYGSTETGQVAWRQPTASEVWQTFGAITVRPQQAHESEDGGASERYVFEGDFIPAPTPMADVLELLDAQRFRLFGRANDLIHVAGRRSSLGHLNFHLNSIPGVQDGAFWIPDEVADGVVRPVVFVVAPQLSAADVIEALRGRMEAVFVPRRVLHVAALPREGTGKLTVRALREFALAQLGGAAAPTPAADDDGSASLQWTVPLDHPSFAGHFPGQPLLPGALLLAQVQEAWAGVSALRARLGDAPVLAAAKFLAPVRPGARLRLQLQPEAAPSQGLRFELWVQQAADGKGAPEVLAISGRWLPGAG
ncbi:AMP-binding protein [Xenophilus arseniciresistens]|uniref:AMP-binding protein n=1 Tax=Xenophilus arseniciresistens TaxID=1283306 RepID=A0AAE3T2B1_9BURK|nr:AMP-binding protein [Xenophilus arseniciresistens]MDA7418207.1 AMP-binding protein [Xenophilus arseniciresistens]